MQLVECNCADHGGAMLAIVNDVIEHSTALFEYRPRSMESLKHWFEDKEARGYPVIGAMDGERFLGFATYGVFRDWPAYKYTVEHSVHVDRGSRGAGVGQRLLGELVAIAEERGLHMMVAGVDAENEASIALHLKLGFEHAGTVREAGFKFGRWRDLAFYQRILRTPLDPEDG